MDDLYIEEDGEALREMRGLSAYSGIRLLITLFLFLYLVSLLGTVGLYLKWAGPFIGLIGPEVILLWVFILVFLIVLGFVARGLALALLDIADAQLKQIERSRRTSAKPAGPFPQ